MSEPTEPKKYRKRPIAVETEQYREGVMPRPKGVCVLACVPCPGAMTRPRPVPPHVHTMHNNQAVILKDGDWIMPESDGVHFYPCDAEVFAATYEEVPPQNTLAPCLIKDEGEETKELGKPDALSDRDGLLFEHWMSSVRKAAPKYGLHLDGNEGEDEFFYWECWRSKDHSIIHAISKAKKVWP